MICWLPKMVDNIDTTDFSYVLWNKNFSSFKFFVFEHLLLCMQHKNLTKYTQNGSDANEYYALVLYTEKQ